jgi:hypothetical protein
MEWKNTYRSKEAITRMKTEPIEGENMFANYSSDKGFITRIYKELKN